MIDKNYVKQFLRVDFDDDDSYIELCIDAAKEYVKNSVGKPVIKESGTLDESNPLVKLLLLNLCVDMYERRSFTTDKMSEKTRYTIRSIIRQLELGGENFE